MSGRGPVFLPRNRATANRCQEILGLPDENWTGVKIEFGTDGQAIATVGIILTPEQLIDLAQLATVPGS